MREKLIKLISMVVVPYFAVEIADILIANGVTFETDNNVGDKILCQNCTHHDTDTCPENRVWCKYLRRYMKLDGYCSYGVKGEEKNES